MQGCFLLESKMKGFMGVVYLGDLDLPHDETRIKILASIRHKDDEFLFKTITDSDWLALRMTAIANNKPSVKVNNLNELIADYLCWLDTEQKKEAWKNDNISWGPGPENSIERKKALKAIEELSTKELGPDEFALLRYSILIEKSVDKLIEETIPEIIKKIENKNNIRK